MSYTYKFKKGFEYEGVTYVELVFNFDKLTGRDMIKAESEARAKGNLTVSPDTDEDFQAILAAKAANVGSDLIENLPIAAFKAITTQLANELVLKKSVKAKELNVNFSNLKGKDLIEVSRRTNLFLTRSEFSLEYQARLVAKAIAIDVEDIKGWKINDFFAVVRQARLFLLTNQG